ncbi:hypothetical protein Plhal304r1_c047g0129491 [Plasmopara halstedii]
MQREAFYNSGLVVFSPKFNMSNKLHSNKQCLFKTVGDQHKKADNVLRSHAKLGLNFGSLGL